jgi:hypothetical protein
MSFVGKKKYEKGGGEKEENVKELGEKTNLKRELKLKGYIGSKRSKNKAQKVT